MELKHFFILNQHVYDGALYRQYWYITVYVKSILHNLPIAFFRCTNIAYLPNIIFLLLLYGKLINFSFQIF